MGEKKERCSGRAPKRARDDSDGLEPGPYCSRRSRSIDSTDLRPHPPVSRGGRKEPRASRDRQRAIGAKEMEDGT